MRRAVLICVLAMFLLPATAHAAFPGQNGKIAFWDTRDDPDPTGCDPDCNAEIYSVNPDGTGVARLTNNPAYDATPAWSPDGQKIVFARRPNPCCPAPAPTDVVMMNADGSGETVLGPGYDPSWSPDGSKIVFVWFDESFGCDAEAIVTMNADGTGRSLLSCASHFGPFAPVWSPDGGLIAYADADGPGLDIWTIRPDGTGAVNHHNSPDSEREANPNWSPDGTKILYDNDLDNAIWRMDRDGSNQTSLTPGDPLEESPAYSPDGTQIAFSGGFFRRQLRTMSSAGGPATFVTLGRDPDWQPIPIDAYPRPKGASPVRVSLVYAYNQCTVPNRTHGPPLAFASCEPPGRSSYYLLVGTGDSNGKPALNEGHLRLRTINGNPSTSADEADVAIDFFSDDVFNLGMLDYTGELRASFPLTITDKDNTPHPGGPGAGTTQEVDFTVDATCVATADPREGSSCQTTTSADALIPGAIKEGRRSIWQLGQVVVYDGGNDGDTATADNTVFARQGVFIP